MEPARSAEGSAMDRVTAIGSPAPQWPPLALAGRDASPTQNSAWISAMQPKPTEEPVAEPVARKPDDPAADQQRMLHFISHVDAECFISLLQTMDPMPYDYRARAEYKRFYRQLHETLEVPLPPVDRQPFDLSTDPPK